MLGTIESNRVLRHVASTRAVIDSRINAATGAPITDEDLAKLDADMAVSPTEHFAFQEAQARAHASGRLTTEEAQVVYIALGEVGSQENGGWAAGTDLATKVSVTTLMGQILGR